MRFDLEIPSTNIDLVFIEEGNSIPFGMAPISYIQSDTMLSVPSDLVSIAQSGIKISETPQSIYEVKGPTFNVLSSHFLLTHIGKYVANSNTVVPLFLKHALNSSIPSDAISIVDYYGATVSKDSYLVQTESSRTTIYMNKPGKVLFVQYISSGVAYKKLLNLQPIFTEASWSDLVGGSTPKFKYTLYNGMIDVSYGGTLYITYKAEEGLVQPPIANIESRWHANIIPASFTRDGHTYSVPEYYIQKRLSNSSYKNYTDLKCKVIHDSVVKLQKSPSPDKLNAVSLKVTDGYTGALKSAFTTNVDLLGTVVTTGINWQTALDINLDGYVYLPVILEPSDIVTATFQSINDMYEFRLVDIKSSSLNQGGILAIYMAPDVSDVEAGVYCCYIGSTLETKSPKPKVQGQGLLTVEAYESFIESHHLAHLCYIATSANSSEIINIYDARRLGGEIIDKQDASLSTADVFYNDILIKNLILPTNDTVLALLETKRLITSGLYKDDPLTTDDLVTIKMFQLLENVVRTNIDISTDVLFRIKNTSTLNRIAFAGRALAGFSIPSKIGYF